MTEKIKKKRSTRKTSIEKVRAEVFDKINVVKPEDEGYGIRQEIKNSLSVADNRLVQLGVESHLEKMWDEVTKFTDTNEIVRLNLQQIQVMFQDKWKEYHEKKVERQQMLAAVLDKGEDFVSDYVQMKSQFSAEESEEMKTLMLLSQRVEGMAKEYRQCALQKKWVVHISLVIQFKLAVESAIHRNVSDPKILSSISADISKAAIELFRVNTEEDA